jgi:CRISPR/Cas system-associated endoribonuclease Cas2
MTSVHSTTRSVTAPRGRSNLCPSRRAAVSSNLDARGLDLVARLWSDARRCSHVRHQVNFLNSFQAATRGTLPLWVQNSASLGPTGLSQKYFPLSFHLSQKHIHTPLLSFHKRNSSSLGSELTFFGATDLSQKHALLLASTRGTLPLWVQNSLFSALQTSVRNTHALLLSFHKRNSSSLSPELAFLGATDLSQKHALLLASTSGTLPLWVQNSLFSALQTSVRNTHTRPAELPQAELFLFESRIRFSRRYRLQSETHTPCCWASTSGTLPLWVQNSLFPVLQASARNTPCCHTRARRLTHQPEFLENTSLYTKLIYKYLVGKLRGKATGRPYRPPWPVMGKAILLF